MVEVTIVTYNMMNLPLLTWTRWLLILHSSKRCRTRCTAPTTITTTGPRLSYWLAPAVYTGVRIAGVSINFTKYSAITVRTCTYSLTARATVLTDNVCTRVWDYIYVEVLPSVFCDSHCYIICIIGLAPFIYSIIGNWTTKRSFSAGENTHQYTFHAGHP